jgi:hypothetical protein
MMNVMNQFSIKWQTKKSCIFSLDFFIRKGEQFYMHENISFFKWKYYIICLNI